MNLRKDLKLKRYQTAHKRLLQVIGNSVILSSIIFKKRSNIKKSSLIEIRREASIQLSTPN